MPNSDFDDTVASLDSARRSLVLLGALLYPLSDERAALDNADADGYLSAVAARMQGVCGQSRAVLENSLKLVTERDEKKRRRRRRGPQPLPDFPDGTKTDVERILAECEVPDALQWVHQWAGKGRDPGDPLEELVPFAARISAAAVRVAVLAADRIDPSSGRSGEVTPGGGDNGDERAVTVASGIGRTARRIAHVLDEWDMLAESPTAMIGCPPPPGTATGHGGPVSVGSNDGRRSLGVAAALGPGRGSTAATAPLSALRRSRTAAVWSSGGAVQRD